MSSPSPSPLASASASMILLLLIVHVSVLLIHVVEVTAFVAFPSSSSSLSSSSSRSLFQSKTTILFAAENNNDTNNQGKGFATDNKKKKSTTSSSSTTSSTSTPSSSLYPALRRDEVQAFLDTVPVYAVTEPNQEGLVLVKEKNNPKDIAYFFFSPQAANDVFTPLRTKKGDPTDKDEWNVSAYPLGLVWFELITGEPEGQNEDGTGGVEYRLLPAPDDLIGAQNLLREQAKQQGKSTSSSSTNDLFRAPYNEVPIFVDQFLRVTTAAAAAAAAAGTTTDNNNKQEEKVPMYIGLQDLMKTCNQAIKATSGDYQAAMSVISLKDLIEEMMAPNGNTNDYRKAILVQPSLPSSSSSSSQQEDPTPDPVDTFTWEGKQDANGSGTKLNKDEGLLSIPTATNDWSD